MDGHHPDRSGGAGTEPRLQAGSPHTGPAKVAKIPPDVVTLQGDSYRLKDRAKEVVVPEPR